MLADNFILLISGIRCGRLLTVLGVELASRVQSPVVRSRWINALTKGRNRVLDLQLWIHFAAVLLSLIVTLPRLHYESEWIKNQQIYYSDISLIYINIVWLTMSHNSCCERDVRVGCWCFFIFFSYLKALQMCSIEYLSGEKLYIEHVFKIVQYPS